MQTPPENSIAVDQTKNEDLTSRQNGGSSGVDASSGICTSFADMPLGDATDGSSITSIGSLVTIAAGARLGTDWRSLHQVA
jgi:hypothetical protein